MGLLDEIVGDIVYIAKKEAKKAIIDGLRQEFGRTDTNVPFRREYQPSGNPRRNTRTVDEFRMTSNQNRDYQHRNDNLPNDVKGGNSVAEDITQNSEITQYQNTAKALCIKSNDKNNRSNYLQKNKTDLLQKYPGLGMADAVAADFFDEIIKKVFIDGIAQDTFVRNYTFGESNTKYPKLAIRYKRIPHDYLTNALPMNKTLLFKGYVSGDYFIVDDVSEQYDEDLLSYEVPCRITRFDDGTSVKPRSKI